MAGALGGAALLVFALLAGAITARAQCQAATEVEKVRRSPDLNRTIQDLEMIKNQIEAMGGDISISSWENEGSTFFINFNKHQIDGS